MEVRALTEDLKYSSEQLDPIIKAIDKLQKDCIRSVDNIENTVLAIDTNLKNKIKSLGINIDAKEKEWNNVGGCSWW